MFANDNSQQKWSALSIKEEEQIKMWIFVNLYELFYLLQRFTKTFILKCAATLNINSQTNDFPVYNFLETLIQFFFFFKTT